MTLRFKLLTTALLLLSNLSFAQDAIVSDRPGFTFSSTALGAKYFQYQGGLTFSSPGNTDIIAIENDFRYGVTDRLEVDVTLAYQSFSVPSLNANASGVSMLRLGTRYQIMSAPESGVDLTGVVQYDFLQLSDEVGETFNRLRVFGSLSYLDLGDKTSLNVNLGLSTVDVGMGQHVDPFYTINLGVSLSEKASFYVEHFGEENISVFNYGFTGGFSFLTSPRLQVDVFGGVVDNRFFTSTGFGSAGLSYRFN